MTRHRDVLSVARQRFFSCKQIPTGEIAVKTSRNYAAGGKQRRSQRILVSVSIRVTGKSPEGRTLDEETSTLIVNAHGALILLKEEVSVGQTTTVEHLASRETIECVVKVINPGPDGVPEVAVEFQKGNPRFWHISFPPEDWSAHGPESKRFVAQPQPSVTAQVDPALVKK
jgi:hypothetical protein